MPLTNGRAVLNFKINGYLKFYFLKRFELTVNGTARKSWNVPTARAQP